MMHKKLEQLPMFSWLSLKPGGIDEIEELDARESVVSYDYLVGNIGTTKTRLIHPAKRSLAMILSPSWARAV